MLIASSTDLIAYLTLEAFYAKRHRLTLERDRALNQIAEACSREERLAAHENHNRVVAVLRGERAN